MINEIKEVENVFGGFRMTEELKLTPQKVINLKTGVNKESNDQGGKSLIMEIEHIKSDDQQGESNQISIDNAHELDEILIEPDDSYAIVPGILSKYAYRKEWSDYQNLAKKIHDDQYDFYVHIDIAHFYNDINLSILEKGIRGVVHKKDKIIDLLFFFLKNSDRNEDGFDRTTVGIPQEDVGEMSRLLANFYLTPFDKAVSALGDEEILKNTDCLYTRYADDIWIAFNGKMELAYLIIQKLSLKLNDLKLHINEKKLLILNNLEFGEYWKFDVWINLKNNSTNLDYLVKLKNYLYSEDRFGRWYSPYSYTLTVIMNNYSGNIFENNNEETKKLIEQLLNIPQLAFTGGRILKPKVKEFFTKILEDNSDVIDIFIKYLRRDELLYPSQEYFLYQVLCNYSDTFKIFQFVKEEYFKSKNNDYSWFSKVIIMKFFIDNIEILERDKLFLKTLLKHLGKISKFANDYERRYNIRLLLKFRDNAGQKTLSENYNKPEDYKFINHILSR